MEYIDTKKFLIEFSIILKSKSILERSLIIIWSFMPFLMMISKTITDILIVIIAFSFLIFSTLKNSWSWAKIYWVKYAFFFFLISVISALLSKFPLISLSNGISWIRFPLFAIAISFWLIKDKKTLYFGLIINLLSLIFIFILMGAESLLTEHKSFTWPFRNPLNGPFIHRIGLLFFCISLFILFTKNNFKITLSIFVLVSIFFSLLSGHRAGSFSFIIIVFVLTFWPKFNFRRSFLAILLLSGLLFFYFLFNQDDLDRYFFGIYNLSNSSLLQYLGQWKTGLHVFLDNPLIGVGPTNVQNYLTENLIENFDPYKNKEHPHNHYIQGFSETGIIGGLLYITMFSSILLHVYRNTKNKYDNVDSILINSLFIVSICIFWPFANNYDLFGQQQNAFLWYVISIILITSNQIKKIKKYE